MKIIVRPSGLNGSIRAAASKSSMQRACAAALIRKGTSIIHNPGKSDDDLAALEIIRNLGAVVHESGNSIIIESNGVSPVSDELNCGESGLSIRMFTPIAAISQQHVRISGSGSLSNRPLGFFDEILPLLGVLVKSDNGKLPLDIRGPLQPKNIEVDGSLSSQFLTGLLMAYAGKNARNVSIRVSNLKSKPYIDLTLVILKQFGLKVPVNLQYEEFRFTDAEIDHKESVEYAVEGDWSGAAFLLVAGAIAGPVSVSGLDLTSSQADKAIVDVLMQANAGIAIDAKCIQVHPSSLKGFDFDASDCPDLFPPLTVLASYGKGSSRIRGVHRLKHKESDRAKALINEFGKMGVSISIKDDDLIIEPNQKLTGSNFHSHHDHRIAMACAVAALKAEGDSTISDAQAINKSYPEFYQHLQKLGADVSLPFKQFKT